MADPILEMRAVDKFFPGVHALDDVDFTVLKGEIHGLIGENGAGKSTLMNVLMGIYRADGGLVRLDGTEVHIASPTGAIALGIGMVPQELNLNPYVSAAENIFFGNEIKNAFGTILWKETNAKAKVILHDLGIDIDPRKVVHKLSVAQQQLIQIARVIATGAKLVVLDEPTASLTAKETEFLLSLMRKLRDEGKSIIFISHHLEELLEVTDRITVMRDGKVVNVSPTPDVTLDILIEHMAGKKVAKQKHEARELADDILLQVEGFSRPGEFEDVSFSVRKGEIFGIGGLVGSGRTELVSSIFGLSKPSAGRLFFEGRETVIKTPSQAIKLGMGLVPEERRKQGIFPILSVSENMVISVYDRLFRAMRLQYGRARELTREYIGKLSIKTASQKTAIRNLSGGNQQKVILSRWLVRNTKLLIMDEPTRGIDVNAKGEIYMLIRQLTAEGMTVVIVSSEHEELMTLSDRIMVMHEGRMKGILNTSADMVAQDILETALR